MLLVQQIPAGEGQLERGDRLPAEPRIQLGVRRHLLVDDLTDITEPAVQSPLSAQSHRGAQTELPIGGVRLRRASGRVGAAGIGPDVDP